MSTATLHRHYTTLHPVGSYGKASRRFICIHLPKDKYIDNGSPIDYEQLYAQVVCEIREGVVWCSVGVVSRHTLHLGKQTYFQTLGVRLV